MGLRAVSVWILMKRDHDCSPPILSPTPSSDHRSNSSVASSNVDAWKMCLNRSARTGSGSIPEIFGRTDHSLVHPPTSQLNMLLLSSSSPRHTTPCYSSSTTASSRWPTSRGQQPVTGIDVLLGDVPLVRYTSQIPRLVIEFPPALLVHPVRGGLLIRPPPRCRDEP